MVSKPALSGLTLCLVAGMVLAQTPTASPSFEVASIRPAEAITPSAFQSGKIHLGMKVDAGRVDFGGLALTALVIQAFGIKPWQISAPDWMATERFDIVAKLPDGATADQVPAMLKALLVERFKMAYHSETREQSVYALIVAKGGPKLKEAAAEPEPAKPAEGDKGRGGITIGTFGPGAGPVNISQDGRGRGALISGPQFGTMRMQPQPDGMMRMEASRISIATLADLITGFVDRPVLDETGLKGNYEVTLELSFQDLMSAARLRGLPMGAPAQIPDRGGALSAGANPATASDPSGGAIFTAIQKLGLKLEPRKAPSEIVVVDHMEKTPTEN